MIIADFAVQGTLAREILGNPSHVMTRAGIKVCYVWVGGEGWWVAGLVLRVSRKELVGILGSA